MTMPHRSAIPIFPADHPIHDGGPEQGMRAEDEGRRAFLKLMAASMALAGAGCSGPPGETILPYVHMPESQAPGEPLFYATAFARHGRACGVLVECNMGRPTKVEGNPRHPSSLGATDVFAQASILQLWDPDRSQAVFQGDALSGWQAFHTALEARRPRFEQDGGAGLRILSAAVASPTLAAQRAALLRRYPRARWHVYDPLHDDGAAQAARLAFGRPAEEVFRFERATLVLCLDADVFGAWPGSLRHARDFMSTRNGQALENPGGAGRRGRLLALESTPTLTGAQADDRLALAPRQIDMLTWRLARRLGLDISLPAGMPAADARSAAWENALAAALREHRGRCIIAAGPTLSPATRALVHRMNARLGNAGNTVVYIAAPEEDASHADSLARLSAEMRDGGVDTLLMLGVNPVYNAPADLGFGAALAKVPFSVQLGLYRDETARRASWHLPQAHAYEQWSDIRAHEGTASIVQPVIAPLYGGRSSHQVLALFMGGEADPYALVRDTWRSHAGRDFEAFWEQGLRQGVLPGTAGAVLDLRPAAQAPAPPAWGDDALTAIFAADPSSDDGEFANNAWLQELPRPLTRFTWDNAALLSPATATALHLETGDVVELRLAGSPLAPVTAPVWILPGHADGAVTLPLGYGRWSCGRVGEGVGFNAYGLRTLAAMHTAGALELRKTGRRHVFAKTQGHDSMEGRDIVRMATLRRFDEEPHFARAEPKQRVPEASLYPEVAYRDYKWGMAIDLNACIGCSACTIACQAENNIPVVGKEEVGRGRAMHWIRIDRYYVGGEGQGKAPDKQRRGSAAQRTVFQPVPCMHCEKAPCEEVCPVGATMHDSEGLNVQVYNRCVGTRFCSNNCPYKVRRFNFLQYSNTAVESLKAAQNPEVTVRRRGVMEKCSYCLQRITRARLAAEKQGRPIRDGEVVTACQAACPTEAIVFGDLNDPHSRVSRRKASALDYALLAELNTHPRTTYSARVFDPDPELE